MSGPMNGGGGGGGSSIPVPIPPRRVSGRSESPHQNGWIANRGGDRYVPTGGGGGGGYQQPGPPMGSYNGAFGGPSGSGGYDDRLKRRRSVSPPYRRPYAPVDDRYAPRPRFEAPYPGPPASYMPAYDSYRPGPPMMDRRMDMPPMGSSAPVMSTLDAYDRRMMPDDRMRRPNSPPMATRIEDRLGSVPDREPEKPKGEWTDPNLLEYKVPLHYFVMWWRESHPSEAPKSEVDAKNGVQPTADDEKRYQGYLSDLKTRQLWALFLAHRSEPWFEEKYGTEAQWVELRTELKRADRASGADAYAAELAKGTYDNVDFDAKDTDLPGEGVRHHKVLRPVENLLLPGRSQLFFKSIPKTVGRKEVEEALREHAGFKRLVLSDPVPADNFARLGWAYFQDDAELENVVTKLQAAHPDWRAKIDSQIISGFIRTSAKRYGSLTRMQHDLEQAKKLAQRLEAEIDGVPRASAQVAEKIDSLLKDKGLSSDDDSLSTEQQRERVRIALDQYLSYLKDGLHTCYYCVLPSGAREIIGRRCVRHVRLTDAVESKGNRKDNEIEADEDEDADELKAEDGEPNAITGEDPLDKRLRLLLLDQNQINARDYQGKDKEEEMKKVSTPLIKQEDENKYRCRQCAKLFKAPEFLHKHIPTKHPELFGTLDDDLTVFTNFVLDPVRLEPKPTQPASVNDKLPTADLHPPRAAPLINRITTGRGGKVKNVSARKLPVIPAQGMKEDPRAKKGKIGYRDLDAPAGAEDAGLPW